MTNKKLSLTQLKRPDIETYKLQKKIPCVVVLDQVRSAHNVGAVLRTADAFSIEKVWLTGITPTPPNKEIHKTALGAQDAVDWQHHPNGVDLIQELKTQGYLILPFEQAEQTVFLEEFSVDTSQKLALVFGNEVKGVQQDIVDLADHCIEIPQLGTKHSINVSVCAGIGMWQVFNAFLPQIKR